MALTSHWVTAWLYARLRQDVRDNLIKRDTALVIEGFPRSANTYAATAFWVANGKEIGCVHHLHTPVNVEVAVRRRLPVIVLLRDPLDAVISQIQRSPLMSARATLREYIRLYERVAPLRDDVVVALFEQVTNDFGVILREVNRRFGTTFVPYEATPENESHVRWEVDWGDVVHNGLQGVNEESVSRPSEERSRHKPTLRRHISATCPRELARARAVYEALSRGAPPPGARGGESAIL